MNTASALLRANIEYRHAQRSDHKALVHIENTCFANDRLSARQLLYWLNAAHKVMYVAVRDHLVVGYGLVIMRKGTSLARLYSIGVLSEARGLGIAKQLIEKLEQGCIEKNKLFLRLEVATTNHSAIALYRSLGYREFGYYCAYYEDSSDALRMQKPIMHNSMLNSSITDISGEDGAKLAIAEASRLASQNKKLPNVFKTLKAYPYFQQTTEFTCGPSALLMSMAKLNKSVELTQQAELAIWRSATTIFMTSGHGGTHPLGLAIAAVNYGFKPEVFINQAIPLFLASVRNEQKKRILAYVEEEFLTQSKALNIDIRYEEFAIHHISEAIKTGASVLCLISSYQFDGFKGPHWVSVTHIDDHFLYIHDPEPTEQILERQHVPVSLHKFERYTRYGKARLRTAIILRKD
jgi:ribosomal protein S18 acetylase RimI-like enzyme